MFSKDDYIQKILNLQDVIVTDIEKCSEKLEIFLELVKKEHSCPKCNFVTNKVHDYYTQRVKDLSLADSTNVFLIVRKRRYKCNNCGKSFYEKNSFLPRFQRMTSRVPRKIVDSLRKLITYTDIAKENHVSIQTVLRIFDNIKYPKNTKKVEVLSIDEFKGNAGGEKFQCLLVDYVNKKIVDVLPSRKVAELRRYIESLDKTKVRFFISDMWKPYFDIKQSFFENAIFIVDKFHFVRQCIWAIDCTRRNFQKQLSQKERIYFKRSKKFLLGKFATLSDEAKKAVNTMLYKSPELTEAHLLKELFFKILNSKNRIEAEPLLDDWISLASKSNLQKFRDCANTYYNWRDGILNSFEFQYSNGYIEGLNNKIKVLKRIGFGYRNFERFRNRIFHIFSN